MADSQPLVCLSIRRPPDQQLFLRLKEMLSVFLEKLDNLSFALAASQAKHPSPEATQILQELRTLAGNKANTMFASIASTTHVAEQYIELLEALKREEDFLIFLTFIRSSAAGCIEDNKTSQRAMDEFREGIGNAVRRITTSTSGKRKWRGTKPSLFVTDNVQIVSELFSAIDECNGVLQQCTDYFEETLMETKNEDLLKTDPPSEEEVQLMLAKWTTFREVTAPLTTGWTIMIDSIRSPPTSSRLVLSTITHTSPSPRQKPATSESFWKKNSRRANSSGPQVVTDASEAPNDTTPPETSSGASWRKIFRRPACLSLNPFR